MYAQVPECLMHDWLYDAVMPKLWSETIETHRDAVRGAVLDAAAHLMAEQGTGGVTMSSIAQAAGIGRATLYKYFPDVESILLAWHERQVHAHLKHLSEVRKHSDTPVKQLEAVLETYAFLSHSQHGSVDAGWLHRGAHMGDARQHLIGFLAEIMRQGANAGEFRQDVTPEELATFCLHALEAAAALTSREAVLRLVGMTLAGIRPTAE